jgi:predicted aldo/keto reductase-like oxidoreductase
MERASANPGSVGLSNPGDAACSFPQRSVRAIRRKPLRETDRSLERLKTTWPDLVHIHNLAGDEDLAAIDKKGGLLDAVRRIREQKIARFIGITSHTHPATLKVALERHDFDCTQMALNEASGSLATKCSTWAPSELAPSGVAPARAW